MSKHTPGPWYIEPDVELGYARVRAKNGTEVLYWANPNDAQLCAAAPALLDAAKAAIGVRQDPGYAKLCGFCRCMLGEEEHRTPECAALAEAIKLAEGDS